MFSLVAIKVFSLHPNFFTRHLQSIDIFILFKMQCWKCMNCVFMIMRTWYKISNQVCIYIVLLPLKGPAVCYAVYIFFSFIWTKLLKAHRLFPLNDIRFYVLKKVAKFKHVQRSLNISQKNQAVCKLNQLAVLFFFFSTFQLQLLSVCVCVCVV